MSLKILSRLSTVPDEVLRLRFKKNIYTDPFPLNSIEKSDLNIIDL